MARTKKTKQLIPNFKYEKIYLEKGYKIIAGLDEVGRGSWAGPLVAAACILPRKFYKVRDSKLLDSKDREKLAGKLKKNCIWGIGEVSVEEINDLKLTKATLLAFERAIGQLKTNPDFVLVDGFKIDLPIPSRGLIRGDSRSLSIAAASIIAKVYRDRLMRQMDKKIKGYYFRLHKGYGTKLHQRRLEKLGPSPIHRRNYKPILKLNKG